MLSRLADYIEQRNALKQKIVLAFTYPTVVTFIAFGIVTFLLSYVVPQVVNVFASTKQQLPFLTVMMMALSGFVRNWWWAVLIVVALVAWTLVMLVWMAIARRTAFAKLGISWGSIPRGSRGVNLDGRAPDEAQWPSHNYNHLMEQPTIFYAIALTLALMGMGSGINYWLAWGYVGLRVAHSLIQATVNFVPVRFFVFSASSIVLMIIAGRDLARLV